MSAPKLAGLPKVARLRPVPNRGPAGVRQAPVFTGDPFVKAAPVRTSTVTRGDMGHRSIGR